MLGFLYIENHEKHEKPQGPFWKNPAASYILGWATSVTSRPRVLVISFFPSALQSSFSLLHKLHIASAEG